MKNDLISRITMEQIFSQISRMFSIQLQHWLRNARIKSKFFFLIDWALIMNYEHEKRLFFYECPKWAHFIQQCICMCLNKIFLGPIFGSPYLRAPYNTFLTGVTHFRGARDQPTITVTYHPQMVHWFQCDECFFLLVFSFKWKPPF